MLCVKNILSYDGLKTISYMLEHFLSLVIGSHKNRILKTIFYVLNNNFSYIQLSFVFLLQKDFYFGPDDTDVFFFFASSDLFLFLSRGLLFFGLFSFSTSD